MNNKKFSLLVKGTAFSLISLAGIQVFNVSISKTPPANHLKSTKPENLFRWKGFNIYYTKKGATGSPIILLHNLNPSSSSIEWERIENRLAKKHRVYSIDMLGCGISDKPEILYTNFYYVQLLIDFIKNRICEKTFVVTSGFSASVALLAGVYDQSKFSGMLFINPPSLGSMSQIPTSYSRFNKNLLEIPVIGTLIYNMHYSKQAIEKRFSEKYFYNPFGINTKITDYYYACAHHDNNKGKYLQASLIGKYMNMNLIPGLRNSKVHTDILIGTAKQDLDFISRTWKRIKPDIKIYSLLQAKYFPQLEEPELTVATIEKSIRNAANARNRALNNN